MDTEVDRLAFIGVYSRSHTEALTHGLRDRGVTVVDLGVTTRSVAEARAEYRLPIRTMKTTVRWFRQFPDTAFLPLYLGMIALHAAATLAAVASGRNDLRDVDAVVVPHMGDTSVLVAAPVARFLRVPLVYLSHNGLYFPLAVNQGVYDPDSLAGRVLFRTDRLLHRLADRTVVFSAESARLFAETFGTPRSAYEVIYVAVVESAFDRAVDEVGDEPDVLYWGNFHPHHGAETMIAAAERLPEYEFALAGESPKREPFVAFARERGVENVSFPGFLKLDDLARYVGGADVVFGPLADNPQTEFTIGTKVAEAAYLGKAIVLARTPSTTEVFTHGEDAYLATPGDPADVAQGVERIVEDEAFRERLKRGARSVYEAHFSSDRAAERLIEVCDDARASRS